MKHYNNQKVFRFKLEPKNKYNTYTTWNWKALLTAMETLSPIAFKLYMYIGTYKNSTEFILSRNIACEKLNISTSSYHRAIKELQEKEYIIKDESSNATKDCYIYIE